MFASRWHSPPKPLPVLSCVTGMCRCASRSASSEPCTSPSSTPTRRSPRPVAQHALEDRRLAGARRAHHVEHRHAVAVEVVAVGPRDRVVGVERVLDDPDPHAMHGASSSCATSIDSTSSSSPVTTSTVGGRRTSGSGTPGARSPTRARTPPQRSRAGTTSCSSRAPSHSVSRESTPKANASDVGHDLAQPPAAHGHDRHPPAGGVAHRGVHDGGGDRELVHQAWYAASVRSSAIVSPTSASARSTAASTGGGQPEPDLVDLARLAADDDDLAREPADRVDEAQHRRRVHARAG